MEEELNIAVLFLKVQDTSWKNHIQIRAHFQEPE